MLLSMNRKKMMKKGSVYHYGLVQPKVFVFFCVVFFFFLCFVFFYFFKISKFALPGVMLIYERTSIDRKKERL